MSLDAPRLDDRSFQDLVDDAKRYVTDRCVGWTDHNVSDPGVTLIEAFAWMTDLMLYRLNRVPERSYIKFLEMIGVTLRQPSAAVVDVDFRLSAAVDHDVTVPARTVVSSERTTADKPVLFTLSEEEVVRSVQSEAVVRVFEDGEATDWTGQLGMGRGFEAFSEEPVPGDGVYLRFPTHLDRHIVLVTATCVRGAGHGIEVDHAPVQWEISTADGWKSCDAVGPDGTGGFNLNGHQELAIPEGHSEVEVGDATGFWLRCVVVRAKKGQREYRSSPRIVDLTGASIGVVGKCTNAAPIEGELLGESSGVAGQEFQLVHQPVVQVDGEILVVEVHPEGASFAAGEWTHPSGAQVTTWEHRDNFADSGPEHRHFTLDATKGILRFGPQVRLEDGSIHQFGATPPKGSFITLNRYWTGGGESGNVSPNVLRVLRSSVPHIRSVRNRKAALGGVDAETVDEAKLRGPLELRARNRAVTAEDFEYLAGQAAPEIRQVRCIEDEEEPGAAAVRVLVVPDVRKASGEISLDDLNPSDDVLDRIAAELEQRRLVGTRVRVEPPLYIGLSIDATIEVQPNANPATVKEDALRTLNTYFNPVVGG